MSEQTKADKMSAQPSSHRELKDRMPKAGIPEEGKHRPPGRRSLHAQPRPRIPTFPRSGSFHNPFRADGNQSLDISRSQITNLLYKYNMPHKGKKVQNKIGLYMYRYLITFLTVYCSDKLACLCNFKN